MKPIVILLFTIVLYTPWLKAQKTKAILIFKNRTHLEGLAELNYWEKIKFRKEKGDERKRYTFEEVDTLKLFEDQEPSIYVQVKIKDEGIHRILELVDQGKNLIYYRDKIERYYAPSPMPNGNMSSVPMGGSYSYTNSYVRKPWENEATYLASTSWLSGNFKKTASNYFADCPALVAKIQNKEFKKRHLKEIIDYYNTKCE